LIREWIFWPYATPTVLCEETALEDENAQRAMTCTIGLWIPTLLLLGAGFLLFEHNKVGAALLLTATAVVIYFIFGSIARSQLRKWGFREA